MSDQLTVYFTSDTHGFIFPTNFISAEPAAVGLLSMAFPKDGNTLIIDGGDTLQGSPLTYYCHTNGVPMPTAAIMNAMGYDYVTLGNHDFNYGYGALQAHLSGLQAQCLCANVVDAAGAMPLASHAVHVMKNGLRVGIVGAVTDWVNRWEKPENLTHLRIRDPYAAMAEAVATLQGKVDVLIGLYHGGFEKDLHTGNVLSTTDENIGCKLCETLPFDILLTGHQHMGISNTVYHGTHVVQTPCNASAYARVQIDAQGGITSALIRPQRAGSMSAEQAKLYQAMSAWLDSPIGHLSQPLAPADKVTMALQGSAIARFFNLVQMDATGAQVSCASLGNEVRGFERNVTVRDVVASYVYANTLVVFNITGQLLRQALEQCARFFAVGEDGAVGVAPPFRLPKEAFYNYDFFDGIRYTFDLRNPEGQRVTRMERGGVPVTDTETLTLVMNHYRATGAGDFEMYLQCDRVQEHQTEVSELILNYLRTHADVTIPADNSYTVIVPDGKPA